MDDKEFTQADAEEWSIQIERSQVRDQDIYPWLTAWMDRIGALNILDIGCGQGICADKIDLTNRFYTGVEPSPFLVDRARQIYPADNRLFVEGNIYQLPSTNAAFDTAFSVTVWHLLEHIDKAAQELSRVLKPRGHFVIVTANPKAYELWTGRYVNTKTEGSRFTGIVQKDEKTLVQDILYLHTLSELLQSLESAHLVVSKTECFRENQFIWIEGRKS